MSIPEIGGLSLIIAILVAGAFFFSGFFKSSSTGDGQAPSGETSVTPALPAKGKLLTLNSAEPCANAARGTAAPTSAASCPRSCSKSHQ